MARRPVVLFDVMDTLVTDPYYRAMPAFFGMSRKELRKAIHQTSWIEFEEGHISQAEYLARFFDDGRPVDGDALDACLKDAYGWVDGAEQLLADLQDAGYEMHAFSNYSVWYRIIEEKLRLSRYLQWSFVSCLTGLRKPAQEAYQAAAETLQVDVGDCLLIDDRTVNVDAAREFGLDAILVESSAQVRAELSRRRILDA
ncbi:MAG: HAD-IA family hydrolase [Planctomycetes bacterium]|nr:HAD-IA family hydrolase [Planctomycetota bacterium]MBL7041762.1 HAD-IA family hydrolase [Pirellulaceae bacterium]